jgi:hypothetical protein
MKKKLIIFFTIAVLVFISLPLLNYYVDIARVFSKSYDKHYKGQLPNELYLQSQFVLEHPKYTKLLFGSSRVGNGIDLTQNNGWYKAWHQGANLEEHLNTLKYLLYKGKKIDEVFIAIDYLSFFSKANKNDYFRQNPPMNLEETLKFYNFYFFRKPTKKDLNHFLKSDLIPKRKHIFSNEAIGMNRNDDYFKNQAIFMSNRQINDKNFNTNVKALKEMKQICESNGIKFSFFVNPFHYKNYYGQDVNLILNYKKELAKIQSYFDCSLIVNKYTEDLKYWVDVSHYNKKLGNLILTDMETNKNMICKKINSNNVEDLNNKYIKSNLNKLEFLSWKDIKIVPHKSYLKKGIYVENIDESKIDYSLKNIPNLNLGLDKVFIKLDVIINKPTNIKITLGDKVVEQKLRFFNGWPKVTKNQTLGIVLKAKDLQNSLLLFEANKILKFKKIEVFPIKGFH